jgi:hypothetical protein
MSDEKPRATFTIIGEEDGCVRNNMGINAGLSVTVVDSKRFDVSHNKVLNLPDLSVGKVEELLKAVDAVSKGLGRSWIFTCSGTCPCSAFATTIALRWKSTTRKKPTALYARSAASA